MDRPVFTFAKLKHPMGMVLGLRTCHTGDSDPVFLMLTSVIFISSHLKRPHLEAVVRYDVCGIGLRKMGSTLK